MPWDVQGCRCQRPAGEEGPLLILVDSSGWIEYLTDRPLARRFAMYLEGSEPLLLSAIEMYEVCKVLRRGFSEQQVSSGLAALRRTTIVPVDESLALNAVEVSLEHGLAMADSIIYATARRHDASLVTADSDFEDLPGVTVVR
ncbi:MAG: type II toxin-antitoxin system VapC family toxin [Candidatus Rokuibacteriota bacterium]